ncbi:MAG: alpha-hydroxy-acid oxidizing protein [Betaproteobacteria bacterium]|nr:MAG: alpha-hydroxy-acid oxidizing protein [Betaproteobacteria bacterium]RPI48601.1 MAG: alpha-hydroxy-acid oxidizing protein [Betaproteobacteria bacterium]
MNDTVTQADRAALRPASAAEEAAKTPRRLQGILSLEDFEAPARRLLPRPIYGFISGGVETNAARDGNRAAFTEYQFLPRVLVNTRARHQKTTLFGRTYDLPFGFPPMGGTSLAAYMGDIALAKVAAELNTVMIQSGASLMPMERVREAGPTAWFQAYLPGEPAVITPLVERVERAGFEVLVLTVDVQVSANRENNVRAGYSSPLKPRPRLAWDCMLRPRWLFGTFGRTLLNYGMPHLENLGYPRIPIVGNLERQGRARDGLSWEHVELMRKLWKGKLVLKGVLSPADVRIARESGVDGIMVSNHGGRQLDGTVSPLRMLPGVAAEAGNMAVMMDSGIRRGTDVLKAFALGAQFVFVGRPFLYAAAVAGEAGVHHGAKLLKEEISRDMAMLGISSMAEMKRELLVPSRGPTAG